MEITVVIVDDFPLVREGIAAALRADPAINVVGEAGSAAEAVKRVRELHPDVVVLDLRMPGGDGAELIEQLRREVEGLRILVVTAIEKIDTMQTVAAAGAAGYVTKRIAPRDLRSAIITIQGGGTVFDALSTEDLLHSYPQISSGEEAVVKLLTTRESDVLALVARGHSDKEVAARLSLSVRTVQNHLTSIRHKTGLRRRSELASWAIKHAFG